MVCAAHAVHPDVRPGQRKNLHHTLSLTYLTPPFFNHDFRTSLSFCHFLTAPLVPFFSNALLLSDPSLLLLLLLFVLSSV